jgi:hypothetical protein
MATTEAVRNYKISGKKCMGYLLGAFPKFPTGNNSIVMSVCLSILPEGFSRNLTFEYFIYDMSDEFKFGLNLKGITGNLHERLYAFMIISLCIYHRVGNFSGKSGQKMKTNIYVQKKIFRKSCRL